jgi:hypothetical protein
MLITTRELPSELAGEEGERGGVRVMELQGFETDQARQLVEDRHLEGDADAWSELVRQYGGNGLALRIVSETIHQVFGGDIAEYIRYASSGMLAGGIKRLLDSQFERLSTVEREVLDVLAIEHEPLNFGSLARELERSTSRAEILEALEALRHRSLVERAENAATFTLQSVVLEYVTDGIVRLAAQEIDQCDLHLLRRRALVKAQARDHVRRAQEQLIAAPIVELIGNNREREPFHDALEQQRTLPVRQQGFGPGNLVNLLRLQRGNLRGTDLSGLTIRQAYLQETEAQDVNLAGAQLEDCVLGDAFGAVGAVAISRNGQHLAAGTLGGGLRVWRIADRAPLLSARAHAAGIWGISFSPSGDALLSGSLDGSILEWSIENGSSGERVREAATGITRLAISGDGWLAYATASGFVKLSNSNAQQTLQGHHGPVYGLAFSSDGPVLATGGTDGLVLLWDTETGQLRTTYSGHAGIVWGVAVSADARIVASCGLDGTVRLWDGVAGIARATLHGHTGAVRSVARMSRSACRRPGRQPLPPCRRNRPVPRPPAVQLCYRSRRQRPPARSPRPHVQRCSVHPYIVVSCWPAARLAPHGVMPQHPTETSRRAVRETDPDRAVRRVSHQRRSLPPRKT